MKEYALTQELEAMGAEPVKDPVIPVAPVAPATKKPISEEPSVIPTQDDPEKNIFVTMPKKGSLTNLLNAPVIESDDEINSLSPGQVYLTKHPETGQFKPAWKPVPQVPAKAPAGE